MVEILAKIPLYKMAHATGWPRILPLNLTVSVTYRCNSRCLTCNVYTKKAEEFTVEEFDRTFSSLGRAPYWYTMSGGEPFLRSDLPDARLLVLGTGQDQVKLEALAKDLGLDDVVNFAGWVDPGDVSTYMAAADIFVGPSKQSASGWREGLGLVFLEAMAAGTAVIATRSGGIPDIVVDGETGLLVAENAPDEIATAVGRIHADPALAASLATNGRALVTGTYTRQVSAAAFARLFDELVS